MNTPMPRRPEPHPGTQVCGLGLTPRPTYDSTLGNDQFPDEYRVFAFDEDPGNPAAKASFADWKTKVAAGEWEGGTEVAHGTDLQYGNKEQYVTFPATTKRVFALTGLRSLAPGKKDMALSDIKLLPCDAEGNAITSYGSDDTGNNNNVARPVVPHPDAPASGSGASDLVVDFVIDQLPYGEPGKPADFAPGTHTYTATGYYHAKAVSARIRAVDGATVTINGATPDADGRVSNLDLTTGLNVITATVSKDGSQATYVVNITKVDTDFRGNVMIPATAQANGGTEADNAALTDLDPTTTWTSDPLVRANDWSSSVTGIELHLGEARYVHRVNGWGTPTLPAGKTPVAPAVDKSMFERYSGFNPGDVGRQPRPGARPAVRCYDARVGPLRGLRTRRLRRQRARPHGSSIPDVLRPADIQHRHDGVPGQGRAVGPRQGPHRQEQHVQRGRSPRLHERIHEALRLHARRHPVRR